MLGKDLGCAGFSGTLQIQVPFVTYMAKKQTDAWCKASHPAIKQDKGKELGNAAEQVRGSTNHCKVQALSPTALLALQVPPAKFGLIAAEITAATIHFQQAGFTLATFPVPPACGGALRGMGEKYSSRRARN